MQELEEQGLSVLMTGRLEPLKEMQAALTDEDITSQLVQPPAGDPNA